MVMSGYQYVCSGGESFDSIARDVYQDEKYAAELMCANPHLCDLFVFTGGERMLLPIIDAGSDSDESPVNAPWKE